MANENDPLFYLPSLQQYQRAQRDAESSEVSGLLNKRLLSSSYDLSRQLGYKTPEERQIEAANKVMADAQMGETETDPIDRQFNVLARAAQSFNAMGLSEYVQKIAPELARLRNQKAEQIKLLADAEGTVAKTKETNLDVKLKNATFDSSVEKAEAEAEAARTGEKLWFNQDTGRYRTVNEKSKAETALAKAQGFNKYESGVGADKEALLAKKTEGDLQTAMVDTDKQLSSLQDLAHTFRPEFLSFESKVKNWGANIYEQMGGDLTGARAGDLTKYAEFRRLAADSFNSYVKAMTGAQMSGAEVERYLPAYLNADKDGSTQFKSKLRSIAKVALQVRKRTAGYLENHSVLPTLKDGTPDTSIWEHIPLPKVSDDEVNAFLGPLAGEVSSDDALLKKWAK